MTRRPFSDFYDPDLALEDFRPSRAEAEADAAMGPMTVPLTDCGGCGKCLACAIKPERWYGRQQ